MTEVRLRSDLADGRAPTAMKMTSPAMKPSRISLSVLCRNRESLFWTPGGGREARSVSGQSAGRPMSTGFARRLKDSAAAIVATARMSRSFGSCSHGLIGMAKRLVVRPLMLCAAGRSASRMARLARLHPLSSQNVFGLAWAPTRKLPSWVKPAPVPALRWGPSEAGWS
jgi:hypothetical protein